VGKGRRSGCGQRQSCGRDKGFCHSHGRSPWLGLLVAAHHEGYGFRSERLRKALFIRGLRERRNLFAIVSSGRAGIPDGQRLGFRLLSLTIATLSAESL
jgi:hypothetical protein